MSQEKVNSEGSDNSVECESFICKGCDGDLDIEAQCCGTDYCFVCCACVSFAEQ